MGEMSPWHWALVIGVAILLFGAKRLPDAARSLGQSARILRGELRGDVPAAPTPADPSGRGGDAGPAPGAGPAGPTGPDRAGPAGAAGPGDPAGTG